MSLEIGQIYECVTDSIVEKHFVEIIDISVAKNRITFKVSHVLEEMPFTSDIKELRYLEAEQMFNDPTWYILLNPKEEVVESYSRLSRVD